MPQLSKNDQERYSRQITLPEIGVSGQQKLKAAHVVLAGAGGLGSSAGYYLAAAGIGRLRVLDCDQLELSNLNRQVLHGEGALGKSKVGSAVRRLGEFNSAIDIEGIDERITDDSAVRLLEGADAVVDCMDNFEARFALNAAALKLGIPFFHGACYGMEGRVALIVPGKTPCLRCLVPSLESIYSGPPGGKPPVLGSTPGIIGAIQAAEVVKYFTGAGKSLAGRLLVYDGLNLSFNLFKVERDADCPACGKKK
ncbi:MAG: HesA/MoeB/ThiF family protein [Elusimicrobiota bacterium]